MRAFNRGIQQCINTHYIRSSDLATLYPQEEG